jgi:hypothetical protein
MLDPKTNRPLAFAGGDVSIPRPTRADLILSATQWVTRAREELFELRQSTNRSDYRSQVDATNGALDHVTRILKELEATE